MKPASFIHDKDVLKGRKCERCGAVALYGISADPIAETIRVGCRQCGHVTHIPATAELEQPPATFDASVDYLVSEKAEGDPLPLLDPADPDPHTAHGSKRRHRAKG